MSALELVESLGACDVDIIRVDGELQLRVQFDQNDVLIPITAQAAQELSDSA